MIDTPKRIPLNEFVQVMLARQKANHARLLDALIARLELAGVDGWKKREVIRETRAAYAANLEQCRQDLTALVASGLRFPDDALH